MNKFESKVDVSKYQSYENPMDTIDLDPMYEYKKVIFTYKEGWARVRRYEKAGWEILYKPSTDGSERLEPVVDERDNLHKSVAMRCLKTQRVLNEQAKQKANEERLRRSIQKIQKSGNNINIQGHDIDPNNIQD